MNDQLIHAIEDQGEEAVVDEEPVVETFINMNSINKLISNPLVIFITLVILIVMYQIVNMKKLLYY